MSTCNAARISLTFSMRRRWAGPDMEKSPGNRRRPRVDDRAVKAQEPMDLTRLLREADDGDREAFDRVLPLVYAELRRAARRQLRHERSGHTLRATALVHEAYLRLADGSRPEWRNSRHFLGVAARTMRQVLIDHARRRAAVKRGRDPQRTELPDLPQPESASLHDLLTLDGALERLRSVDERLVRVVELRFFLGLSEAEIAEALGVTPRTVERDWVKARALLHAEIYGEGGSGSGAERA